MSDFIYEGAAKELHEQTVEQADTLDATKAVVAAFLADNASPKMYAMRDGWGMLVVGYEEDWLRQFDEEQAFVVIPVEAGDSDE